LTEKVPGLGCLKDKGDLGKEKYLPAWSRGSGGKTSCGLSYNERDETEEADLAAFVWVRVELYNLGLWCGFL